MNAYEVMLSESQERMLLVVRPEGVDRVVEIVSRWSLHAAAIGYVTDDGMVRVLDNGEIVCEVPGPYFTDECPTYIREAIESPAIVEARERSISISDLKPEQVGGILLSLLGSPNIGSRRPVFEQYDHTIGTNTVVEPGAGDAAVLRLRGSTRGIATSIDCNSRYCWLDPELGAKHAVAEAARNVVCTGAKPLAMTNCLNFGNPQKPAGYFQLDRAVSGMASACAALNIPVVSGNVSLYNETSESAVMPTPMVGVVGAMEDVTRHVSMKAKSGDVLFLLSAGNGPVLGGSSYLAEVHGLTAGRPPAIDLEAELAVQDAALKLIGDGLVSAAHDCSDGGLAVAVAEMAIASDCGVIVNPDTLVSGRLDEKWFGEAPSRILLAIRDADVERMIKTLLPTPATLTEIGGFGGDAIRLDADADVPLAAVRAAFDGALRS